MEEILKNGALHCRFLIKIRPRRREGREGIFKDPEGVFQNHSSQAQKSSKTMGSIDLRSYFKSIEC